MVDAGTGPYVLNLVRHKRIVGYSRQFVRIGTFGYGPEDHARRAYRQTCSETRGLAISDLFQVGRV